MKHYLVISKDTLIVGTNQINLVSISFRQNVEVSETIFLKNQGVSAKNFFFIRHDKFDWSTDPMDFFVSGAMILQIQ